MADRFVFDPDDILAPDPRARAIAEALADRTPPHWWWLSFVGECQRDGGSTFAGVVMVLAPNMIVALRQALHYGLNPGGEVLGYPLLPYMRPRPADAYRLLDRSGALEAQEVFSAVISAQQETKH